MMVCVLCLTCTMNQGDIIVHICGALRDLVPCAQFKEHLATLLKVTLLHGCFSRFLNCMNGTKSRKAPHFYKIKHP